MDIIDKSYRHYKGNVYKIIGEAKHSETLEDLIIYEDLSDTTKVWVRPKEMFFENVLIDGNEIPRFTLIN